MMRTAKIGREIADFIAQALFPQRPAGRQIDDILRGFLNKTRPAPSKWNHRLILASAAVFRLAPRRRFNICY